MVFVSTTLLVASRPQNLHSLDAPASLVSMRAPDASQEADHNDETRPMSDDKPNHDFAAFVDEAPQAGTAMPLMHTTDLYRFRVVLRSKKIEPRHCGVFGENILYVFYGRPAYRPNQRVGNTSQLAYKPVCLVLRPQSSVDIKRVFPFDTGAFRDGMFSQHVHKDMNILSFELAPVPESAAKLVYAFFGDNNAYFYGRSLPGLTLPNFQFEAQSYYSLVGDKSQTSYDGRRGTAEIQIGKEISLSNSTVAAVAIPTDFCEESEILETVVKEWNADLLPYPSFHASPSDDIRSIFESVGKYLEQNGFIDEAS